MSNLMNKIKRAARELGYGEGEGMFPDPILAEAGALNKAAPFILDKGFRHILVVADENTFRIAGQRLVHDLEWLNLSSAVALIKPDKQGDVIADEASIIQTILEIQRINADLVLAAGSGTLHDIARYAAYTTGLPFISVPTAPSVDGFTSKGAPIIIRGEKITVPAIGPSAIFADLDILRAAPGEMIAAGFADMLGKYTSLFDWKVGKITANEPYSEQVAEITALALKACVRHVKEIGDRTEEGIHVLIEALIDSGLAMLLFGQSHPASGAEHHLSHYWEMEFIRTGKRQLLHGAKVGVACAVIAAMYQELALSGQGGQIKGWKRIQNELAMLPNEAEIRRLLQIAGGPTTIAELGVDPELLERSKREAYRVRLNRHTLLRAMTEKKQIME